MTTARFSQVVARSGRPHVHLTWSAPARDRTLQSAVGHCRLMTLQQNARGQKKDFGLVGLHPGRNVQFLVFPKSLRPFAGKRIVGIDYTAIAEDSVADAGPRANAPRPRSPKSHSPKKFVPAASPAAIVDFPAPATRASAERKPAPPWLAAVRAAAADLKRGRTVAAYERLERLLTEHTA